MDRSWFEGWMEWDESSDYVISSALPLSFGVKNGCTTLECLTLHNNGRIVVTGDTSYHCVKMSQGSGSHSQVGVLKSVEFFRP